MVELKLNLGAGKDIREGYINADFRSIAGVNMVFDFDKFPYPFKDNTFEEIICFHVLEHLENIPKVITELHRIGKPGCKIHIKVPYYNHPCMWVDCTHKHGFTRDTLNDFTEEYNTYDETYPKFKLNVQMNPSIVGKYIYPKKLRLWLSYFLGFILKEIEYKMEVIK